MIDFGALPPEINSGRMYLGPGAAPMLAAATAWDSLAYELSVTAGSFESTVLDLTGGPWRGPASMSMAAAALPFTTWLKATVAQVEQAASQAKAAAAAYEAAFAMTVPPPVIAANRSLLVSLVATNFFGQNTPAIAATEAQYASMWAQDAAAMYSYSGSSQAALQVSPFTSPPETTDPAGLAGDAAAVGQGAETVGQGAESLGQGVGTVGQGAATVPGASPSIPPVIQQIVDQWTTMNQYGTSGFSPMRIADTVSQILITWEHAPNAYTGVRDMLADTVKVAGNAAPGVSTSSYAAAPGGGGLTAGAGQAVRLGGLSVPASWPGTAPTANPLTATLVSGRAAALEAAEAGGAARGAFALPGAPGAAAAAGRAVRMRFVPRYGYRHKMMARPPAGG